MSFDFDVVVIGAGPGGYVAAIRAAQLGLKTAIVEREALGGVCLNWGCIPTKALLKAGEMYEGLDHLESFGMKVTGRSFDMAKIVKRSRDISGQLNAGIAFLMKKNKVEVILGNATLEKGTTAPKMVIALKAGGSRTVTAKHVVLATGARARTIPAIGLQPDGERVWSYREAMVPKVMPKSLVVIGSGAIGIEFASFYRALGAEVTVVEALDRIVPVEDEEVSIAARKAFEQRGIKFHVGAKVTQLQTTASNVKLQLEIAGKPQQLEAERAIVAIGISGNVENLGLEALGVKVDRGHVVTDANCKTNVAGLYAIGDVAGPPWLAHKASHEGIRCVEHFAGVAGAHLDSPIPGCTYATPQIASVGLTEAQAKAAGHDIKVGRYAFKNHGKALASGDTDGFVKTIFDAKTGRILGVHMLGAEVTEMIQGFVVAMTMEATEEQIMATVFPHPTMSEAMHESTLAAYGRAIHA
jgi:dihydrolipoamide dehydrogenase